MQSVVCRSLSVKLFNAIVLWEFCFNKSFVKESFHSFENVWNRHLNSMSLFNKFGSVLIYIFIYVIQLYYFELFFREISCLIKNFSNKIVLNPRRNIHVFNNYF
jgi:hypothetical protein